VELAFKWEKNMFKNLLLVKLFLFTSLTVNANSKIQNFEGSINLKREAVYDTLYITILVKGNFVRIDEYERINFIRNSYIVDLEKETVFALSPQQKLFTEVRANNKNQIAEKDTQIVRTGNCMDYNGYKCCQMRVKCRNRDTEIAYWVADENFDFFTTLVKILKKTKVNISLFDYFPEIEGLFPVLIVERTLLRKERMTLKLDSIQKVILSENSFKIPPDYRKIER